MRAATPGDVLSFTLLRDGETLVVDVTVGEHPVPVKRHDIRAPDVYHGLLNQILPLYDRLARAEIVLETDDGFKTVRAVVGNAGDVDVENGTFVLTPKDGSDPIPYAISTTTRVIIGHEGDLGGLNSEDMTLVVDVDGDVKLVLQGGLPFGRGLLGPLQRGPKPRAHGPSSGPGHFDFWEFASPPELSERFQRAVPLIPPSAFQGEGFGRLPGDLAELLERFRQDLHDLDPSEGEAGSGTEGLTH